nr:glycosyltransferase family A protein [Desulforadius tongensis]
MEPKNRLDLGKYQKGLVSVVIPCYNHGKYLKDAINTVREQTYKKTEIIVVNDGSTDKYTLDVIKEISNAEPDVIVINQENSGLAAARNAGINKAKGEYILPLDADDLLEKDFLSKTVDILNNHPDVGFVYTWVKYFGAADGIWQTPEYDHVHLLVTNLCTAASLFRHNAFDQVGGYNTDMVYGFEDWDFWIALSKHGWRGWCVKEPLFLYRQHGQGSMLSSSQEYREFLVSKVIEHHLDTYQENLPQVLVKKDKMFYDAHIKAYKLSNELNNIYNSKAWKWATRFRKIKEFFK